MLVTKTICDVEGCGHEAVHGKATNGFHIYKDRRADGAGSMENWYYTFDLCPKHIEDFLLRVTLKSDTSYSRDKTLDAVLTDVMKALNIKWRET
jgi:hypothetical protein